MQATFPNIKDLGRLTCVIVASTQDAVQYIPQTRANNAGWQDPNKRIPNTLAVLAAAFDLPFCNKGAAYCAKHHQHSIPAQNNWQA